MLSCCDTVRYTPHATPPNLLCLHPRRWRETTPVVAISSTRISSSTYSTTWSRRVMCRPSSRWKSPACAPSATPIPTSRAAQYPQTSQNPSSNPHGLRRMGYGRRNRPRPSPNPGMPKPKPTPKPKPIPRCKDPGSRRKDQLEVSIKSKAIPLGVLNHRREVYRISCCVLTRTSESHAPSLTVSVVPRCGVGGVERYVP
jgi:hypothetical protein